MPVELAPEIVLSGSQPIMMLDALKNPKKPKLLAIGGNEEAARQPSAALLLQQALRSLPDPDDARFRVLELRVENGQLYMQGQARTHTDAGAVAASLRRAGTLEVAAPRTEQLAEALRVGDRRDQRSKRAVVHGGIAMQATGDDAVPRGLVPAGAFPQHFRVINLADVEMRSPGGCPCLGNPAVLNQLFRRAREVEKQRVPILGFRVPGHAQLPDEPIVKQCSELPDGRIRPGRQTPIDNQHVRVNADGHVASGGQLLSG